jgi:hypothetical protein
MGVGTSAAVAGVKGLSDNVGAMANNSGSSGSSSDDLNSEVNYNKIPKDLQGPAKEVIEQMDEDGTLPPGVQQGGGRLGDGIYGGEGLPKAPDKYYVETDILPTEAGATRADGRLVFGARGEIWFTNHYKDGFVQIRGPVYG